MPLIAQSRLAVMAVAAGGEHARMCAVLDAGRGEFYCGEYEGARLLGERLVSREDAVDAAWRAEAVVVCEDAVGKALAGTVAVKMVAEPTAADALPLAVRRLEAAEFDDPMTLDANYLRRTDAEIFAKPAAPRIG